MVFPIAFVKGEVKLQSFGMGVINWSYFPFSGLGLKSHTKALIRAAISAKSKGSKIAYTITWATKISTYLAILPFNVRALTRVPSSLRVWLINPNETSKRSIP